MPEDNASPARRPQDQLQTLLLSTTDVTDFLQQLAMLATQVIAGQPVSCGITLRYDANVLTVASNDDRAELLDETQYQSHGGPCLQAMETGEQTLVTDCAQEQRWPAYIAVARREGLQCSVSLPLTAGGSTFGAMNIYSFDRPNQFGDDERRQYQLFATQAAGALRLATRQHKDASLLSQFEEALNSRSVIDQALGILMARHGLTSDAAFDLLRRQSQSTHRKLRDIAARLITEVSGAQPAPGRPFETT